MSAEHEIWQQKIHSRKALSKSHLWLAMLHTEQWDRWTTWHITALFKRICYKNSIFCASVANLFAGSKPCENVIQLKESVSSHAFIVSHMVIAEKLAYKKFVSLPK